VENPLSLIHLKKTYLIGELKDVKQTIAEKDELIRQMEARLQRLEMNHEDTYQYRERRHHHLHKHASRTSQSSYGHYEERRQNVARP